VKFNNTKISYVTEYQLTLKETEKKNLNLTRIYVRGFRFEDHACLLDIVK
jgi:hypothetical protein